MIIDRRDKRLAIDLFGSTSINQQPNPHTRFYGAVIFPFKSHCPESFRLNTFTTVVVEEHEWAENTPARYASNYLALLSGLKTILIIWGDFDEDTDELMEIDTKDLHARADEVRAQHLELLKDHKYKAKSIRYIDRRGKFY